MHDHVRRFFNQRFIMRNIEDGQPALRNKRLQPLQGFDIQIIGRLVKQENIRLPHQKLCKLYLHLLAAGERAKLLL